MLTPSSSTLRPEALPTAKFATGSARRLPPDFRPTNKSAKVSSNQFSAMAASAHRPSQSRDVCRQHNLNLPPSSPIHSPIPTPTPSPPRKNETTRKFLPPKKSNRTLKRQTSDAYDYFRSDPDDEWSTLPARKKVKAVETAKPKINGIKTTAAFRLPGTSAKGKMSGMCANSERRVVTFLPPPLKAGKVDVLVEDVGGRSEDKSDVDEAPPRAPKHSRGNPESSPWKGTPKRRRISENPYPSPTSSRLTPGYVNTTVNADPSHIPSSPSPIQPPEYRFPSPPTSDPVPVHDSEIHATVAVDNFSQRYPRTKSLMRQVR
jgi:hypothetical protein